MLPQCLTADKKNTAYSALCNTHLLIKVQMSSFLDISVSKTRETIKLFKEKSFFLLNGPG